jgi:hypothetical protein
MSAYLRMPTAAQLGTFKPSHHSYSGVSETLSYFLEDPLVALGLKESKYETAATPGSKAQKAAAASLASVKTGTYAEGGYAYYYNASTGDIAIVLSPVSTKRTSVSKKSSAYMAILDKILSGEATPVSSSDLAEMKKEVSTSTSLPTYTSPQSSSASPEPTTTEEVPFYKDPRFIPLAIIGVVFVSGGIMIWKLSRS